METVLDRATPSIAAMVDHPLLRGTQYRLVERHFLDADLVAEMVAGLAQFFVVLADAREPLSPPTLIDTAWHEAIIDTANYRDFCETFFGVFLHHHPPVSADDNRPENFALTGKTVDLARARFGDDLVVRVWRRSKRVQALSATSIS